MSRVGKRPVELGQDLTAEVQGQAITIKGKKGSLSLDVNSEVEVKVEGSTVSVSPRSGAQFADAMAGTTRALIANMVTGITTGFQKKLELVGVGYRAAVQGQKLNLTLGFSHPVEYPVPKGITIETPSQTGNRHQGHGPSAGRPGRRRDSRLPSAGALQGQGREVLDRKDRSQGSEEEVGAMANDKKTTRQRRARKTRIRIARARGCMRLCVHRTPQHIYAQIIAPEGDRVVASASTLTKEVREALKATGNKEAAAAVGKAIAERAKQAGMSRSRSIARASSITAA